MQHEGSAVSHHPHAIETYEVLDGEMEFYVKDKWISARKGDRLTVPVGVTHTFRNPSDQVVKVYNTHQPAFHMENYFEDVCKVLDKVTDGRKKSFSMNFKTKLYLGLLMNRYRQEIIAKRSPDFAVRILGYLAKWMGMKY